MWHAKCDMWHAKCGMWHYYNTHSWAYIWKKSCWACPTDQHKHLTCNMRHVICDLITKIHCRAYTCMSQGSINTDKDTDTDKFTDTVTDTVTTAFIAFFKNIWYFFQIPAECAKICFSFLLPPTWRPQFSTHSRPLHFHCWCWQDGHGLNILRQFIHFLKHLVHTFSCKNFIYHPSA